MPVGEQQQQEIEAVRKQLSENETIPKGNPTNQGLVRDVPLQERIKHLLKFAEIIDDERVYRFASHPRF